jgi:hypothetical protein
MKAKSLEIYRHLSLDAVEKAYQEAVLGGQHLMDAQQCQNHGPVRLLVPLLEFNPERSTILRLPKLALV